MHRIRMFGLVVGCGLLIASVRAADSTAPVAELQGRWEVVELVEDGKVVPREAIREWLPSGGKLEISENAVIFTADGDKQVKLFSVDATQYPRRIDLVSKEKTDAVGIYRLDDGKLVLCLIDPAEGNRPDDFSAKEGSHRMLMVLETRRNAKPASMFSTVREVQQIRLFQKAFVRTPVSSGRWSVSRGTLTFAILASTHPDRVNKQFPFAVRSISDRDLIFVDYLGRVGKAVRVP